MPLESSRPHLRQHLLKPAQVGRLAHHDQVVASLEKRVGRRVEQHTSIGFPDRKHDYAEFLPKLKLLQRPGSELTARAHAHLLDADVQSDVFGGEIHELEYMRLQERLRHPIARYVIRREYVIRARETHLLLGLFFGDTR